MKLTKRVNLIRKVGNCVMITKMTTMKFISMIKRMCSDFILLRIFKAVFEIIISSFCEYCGKIQAQLIMCIMLTCYSSNILVFCRFVPHHDQ